MSTLPKNLEVEDRDDQFVILDGERIEIALLPVYDLADASRVEATAELFAAAPDLLWLVARARGLLVHTANWTKAERERSWADWRARAAAALDKVEGRS